MEIERLKEFICLAKTLNYHMAASQCYISQSTLSKHIASLEKELGCRLFVRNKASVALTAYGKLLYGHACNIIGAYEDCLEEIDLVKSDNAKSLSVGYMYEAAHIVLSEAYKSIRTKHGDLGLSLTFKLLQSEEIKGKLDDGSVDVVLDVDTEYPGASIYKRFPIFSDRLSVIVPPTHEFAKSKSIPIERLRGHTLIVPSVSEKGFRSKYIQSVFRPSLLKDIKLEAVFSDPTEIPWYVNSGVGIALASGFVYDELHDPDLVRVVLDGDNMKFNVSAIWKAENETQAVCDFVDVLKEQVESEDYLNSIPPSASRPI